MEEYTIGIAGLLWSLLAIFFIGTCIGGFINQRIHLSEKRAAEERQQDSNLRMVSLRLDEMRSDYLRLSRGQSHQHTEMSDLRDRLVALESQKVKSKSKTP